MNELVLCFKIEEKNLFMDCNLVDYNGTPIFFICRAEGDYYTALCYDLELGKYYITLNENVEIEAMLKGKLPMTRLMFNAEAAWDVAAGTSVENDIVIRINATDMDGSVFPSEDAYYEIVDETVRRYLERNFDKEIAYIGTLQNIQAGEDLSNLFENEIVILTDNILRGVSESQKRIDYYKTEVSCATQRKIDMVRPQEIIEYYTDSYEAEAA
ncbi:MAG: hypothetical protein K6G81_09905 [Lachnospiraceae bacterium]|nr:hypothetical protein [Lachnospiraceae bacterium]